ncbi:RidA family protein [Tomitella fengzijianii]|uniref:RidA family protein n=1 Tax=Tomitella fengzijianii TaxID=2597660 RepID=A0A516WZL0_9ACTN|nr:RidA family protein [Tomitella fengzijianii]QDQ96200.1 RidA family protein [Tomitella fengzijianii]
MTGIEFVNPPELGRPSGFSHAVRAGDTVYLAGETALNAEGRIVGDTLVEQFEKALDNMLTSLRAAGGGPENLVSLTIYIVDLQEYKAVMRDIGRVWKKMIGAHYPATAGIGVARLWDIEARVEVQGIAYLG